MQLVQLKFMIFVQQFVQLKFVIFVSLYPHVSIPMLSSPIFCPHTSIPMLKSPPLVPTLPSSCLECYCISVVVWWCCWDGNMEMGVWELALLLMILFPMLLSKCSHCCALIPTLLPTLPSPFSHPHAPFVMQQTMPSKKFFKTAYAICSYKFLINLKQKQWIYGWETFQIQGENITKTTTRQLTTAYNDDESMAKMTNKTKEFTQINKI